MLTKCVVRKIRHTLLPENFLVYAHGAKLSEILPISNVKGVMTYVMGIERIKPQTAPHGWCFLVISVISYAVIESMYDTS